MGIQGSADHVSEGYPYVFYEGRENVGRSHKC
jgi:hypothetical protein